MMARKSQTTTAWRDAKTSSECRVALAEIDAQIAEFETRKVELTADRVSVVLAGGDVAAVARDLSDADKRLVAFKDTRALIADRLEGALADERRARAEEGLAAAREQVPELKAAWIEFYRQMDALAEASEKIGLLAADISAKETLAAQAEFPRDRFVHLLGVRAEAGAECPAPTRTLAERHPYDADRMIIRSRQIAALVIARAEAASVSSSVMSNAQLLSRWDEIFARNEALARRANLPQIEAA